MDDSGLLELETKENTKLDKVIEKLDVLIYLLERQVNKE